MMLSGDDHCRTDMDDSPFEKVSVLCNMSNVYLKKLDHDFNDNVLYNILGNYVLC